jgi:very-short-patch-repair endonuclease
MTTSRAKRLRKNSTDAERALWRILRSRQLGDGGQHNEEEDIAYDQRRSQWLEKAGFRVMRFWNHEVLNELESVSDAISNALIARKLL